MCRRFSPTAVVEKGGTMRPHLRTRDSRNQAAVALNVLVLAVGMPLGLNWIISGKQAALAPLAQGTPTSYVLNAQEQSEVRRLVAERRRASPPISTSAAVTAADLAVFDSVLNRAGK
jgi:hypothetical protein